MFLPMIHTLISDVVFCVHYSIYIFETQIYHLPPIITEGFSSTINISNCTGDLNFFPNKLSINNLKLTHWYYRVKSFIRYGCGYNSTPAPEAKRAWNRSVRRCVYLHWQTSKQMSGLGTRVLQSTEWHCKGAFACACTVGTVVKLLTWCKHSNSLNAHFNLFASFSFYDIFNQ